MERVMSGSGMLSFVPIHLSAFTRAKHLKNWIEEWIKPSLSTYENVEFLEEADWFWRAHDIKSGSINADGIWIPIFEKGVYVWSPAPAATQFAIEQLHEARNKRTESLHVFVFPRLYTSLWRRQLMRVADVFLTLPFVDGIWDRYQQHEQLTLAFIFPFLLCAPWQLK